MADSQRRQSRPVLKRPRPVLSCLECRRKKLKCDRLLPCQQCLKIDQPSSCAYAPGQEPESRVNALAAHSPVSSLHRATSVENTQACTAQVHELNERVQRLERALRQSQNDETRTDLRSGLATPLLGTLSPGHNNDLQDPSKTQPQFDDNFSLFQKFDEIFEFTRSLKQQQQPDLRVRALSAKMYAIHDAVTSHEAAHSPPAVQHTGFPDLLQQMNRLLPVVRVCNKLIDLYFENFEHGIRILHKSVFLSQNRTFNQKTMHQSQLGYFVPTLLAILCVASNLHTYPECELPELHGSQNSPSAAQLLKSWVQSAIERDGVSIAVIQVQILIIQSQICQNKNVVDLWISSSQLVRQAMIQHLHVEPPSTMGKLEAETRRSLWLSILEQDLALAIMCGMPPQCPSYDLRPITNCNDDELSTSTSPSSPEHPLQEWTDGLCQHILAATFNKRLEAYKHRFAPRTSSHYSETMAHAAILETTLQELPPLFKLDHAANTPGRLMAQLELDITLRRPLIAIYAPYATAATPSAGVYRGVTTPWVQSHLVVMCFQDLFDPLYPGIDVPRPVGYWDFFHTAYRFDAIQSLEAMLWEARCLKQYESIQNVADNLAHPNPARISPVKFMRWDFAGMMKAVEDTLGPMTRRIGPYRENVSTIVKYTLLFFCLQAPYGEKADNHILDGFEIFATNVRNRLESDGYVIQPEADWTSRPNHDKEWLLNLFKPDFGTWITPQAPSDLIE